MPVVADEPIQDRCLGRGRLEGRMCLDDSGGSVVAGIRDTPHADSAIVAWYVLYEPIDGVPRIGALVKIPLSTLLGTMRTHVDELPFRHPAPAYVLIGEDVAFLAEQRRRAEIRAILIRAVRAGAVRRPHQQHRVLLPLLLGDVDSGEQPLAVSHGNEVLELRVICFDVLDPCAAAKLAARLTTNNEHRVRTPDKTRAGDLRSAVSAGSGDPTGSARSGDPPAGAGFVRSSNPPAALLIASHCCHSTDERSDRVPA